MSVVQVQNLTKYYGNFKALNGVSFEVKKGEVLGFIGPNGAGKTTTIRILLGLLRKNGGITNVFGKDAWSEALMIHRLLAYVPGEVNLWPSLTGGEVIDLICKLRGGINLDRRAKMIKRFELDTTKKIHTYSKGNRQKVAIISALASDAEFFIFDEPTSGLDPLMEAVFQESLLELKKMGKTILLSSHTLTLVEKLCDRISIIRKGQIVESGSLSELRHLTRTAINLETEIPVMNMEDIEGVHELAIEGNHVRFQIESDKLNDIMKYMMQYGLKSLTSRPPTLEELFMHHYDESSETDERWG